MIYSAVIKVKRIKQSAEIFAPCYNDAENQLRKLFKRGKIVKLDRIYQPVNKFHRKEELV